MEPIFVRGGPTALAALISGDVDYASVGGAQAPIRSRAKGLDIHIIASQSNYTNYTLLGSKEAKNVEELRGKIIGVTGAGAFSISLSESTSRETTSTPTKMLPCAPLGERHYAPSPSSGV